VAENICGDEADCSATTAFREESRDSRIKQCTDNKRYPWKRQKAIPKKEAKSTTLPMKMMMMKIIYCIL
jgi:hypothetical protein